MAATRLVSGVMREVWSETASQPGGAPQIFVTNIHIDAGGLSRVKGLLTITGFTGTPAVSATADIFLGFLRITVANAASGSTINWLLDVQLTHTVQQAPSAEAAVILVASGVLSNTSPGGTETLAQAYNIGVVAADQTLILDTAKGGGLVIDATTGAVTGPLYSLFVMQSADVFTPVGLARRGGDAFGPILEFNTARGTFGAPADSQGGDIIGLTNYIARINNLPVTATTIQSVVAGISTGPVLSAAIEFSATFENVLDRVWMMDRVFGGSGRLLGFGPTPVIVPAGDHTGQLGQITVRWDSAFVDTANVYSNVCVGGATPGLNALQTVVLPVVNTTPPATSVGLTHIFSQNAFLLGAALAVFQEAPTQLYSGQTATNLIPVVWNGISYYLFAYAPPS